MKDGKIGFAYYNYDNPKSNKNIAGLIECNSFPCL